MKKYSKGQLYGQDEYVIHDGKVWRALRTSMGNTPSGRSPYWVEESDSQVGTLTLPKGQSEAPAYDPKRNYKAGEAVAVNGALYVARRGNQGKDPLKYAGDWSVMLEDVKELNLPDERPKQTVVVVEEPKPAPVIAPKGKDGRDGRDGLAGMPGKDGMDGRDGYDGVGLDFTFEGTKLGIRREDQEEYTYIDFEEHLPKGGGGASGGATARYILTTSNTGTSLLKASKPRAGMLKDLIAGTNVTFVEGDDDITINASGGGGGASELSDLSDVNTSTATNRNVLVADGTDWESRALVEADISDLGTYLTGITGENLSSLADVTITSIASGEILKWNGSAWINNTLAEAGIAAASHTHVEADITDLGAYITASSTDTLTNKSGNISQWTNDAGYITTTLSEEQVEDFVGGMLTGNTETLITVTYQDSDGTIDFVVDNDLNNYSNTNSGFITASSTDTLTNKTIRS